MAKSSLSGLGLPAPARSGLQELGVRIQRARKRRGIQAREFAARMFVSPQTLRRLERGDPGVSLAVLATALHCLGLGEDLDALARAESDAVGNALDAQRLDAMRRVRDRSDAAEFDF